jgi:hypothetical protein
MTSAPLKAVLALVAALPSAAGALQWTGRAGLGYVQDDTSRPATPMVTTQRLDLDLSLQAHGFVYQPDALLWSGGVDYRRLTVDVIGGADTVENRLEYRLQTTAFARNTSPVTFSAFARRQEGDGGGGGIDFGATTQLFGGTFSLRVPERPLLEAGYTRTETEVSSSVRPDSRVTRDMVSAGTAHSGAVYGFSGNYRGSFSEGTYAADNFDDHRVDVNARVRLAAQTQLQLTDSFYRRDPTAESPFNPRQELNVFGAHLRHEGTPGTGEQRGTYQHTAAVTDSLGTLQSRTFQQVTYQLERPIRAQEWFLSANASANLDDRARDAVRERTAGQTLGATVSWRKRDPERALEVHAGPSFGVLEPFDGAVEFGWGAGAGASLQRTWSGVTGGAQYGVSYGTSLGTSGTSLSQQGSVSADSAAGLGRLRGSLLATSDRTNDPLFGSRASRSLVARGEYALRLYAVWLDADVRDGVAGALRGTISGDGLFLAPAYDTHTRSVGGGARGTLGKLLGSAGIRVVNADVPDRPAQNDLELRGEVAFRTGAFGISLEDRYVKSLDAGGGAASVNVFYFRVYRVIGSGR